LCGHARQGTIFIWLGGFHEAVLGGFFQPIFFACMIFITFTVLAASNSQIETRIELEGSEA
jgi:hypothetical protein